MKIRISASAIALLLALLLSHVNSESATNRAPASSWFFTVSGDSRDCGDLIMPKIARYIADHPTQPAVSFYWHLGDFRALYRIDCDWGLARNAKFKCVPQKASPSEKGFKKSDYLADAWPDFKRNQIQPFLNKGIKVFLGIGNHELINRTPDEYRDTFKEWLTNDWIKAQRKSDASNNINSIEGDTYYHFIKNGVDFIYLDNANNNAFSDAEIKWLFKVLDADAKNDQVRTIIVGMHEALPGSTASNHAMDDAPVCADVCNANKVYDRLYDAQNLGGPAAKRKHVYIFSSHSHFFKEDIYNTEAHKNRVLPGWVIGTAGAEQYQNIIQYGYLQVEVRPDGTIATQFKEVTRNSRPLATGNGAKELTSYCFKVNKVAPPKASEQRCKKCPNP